MHVGMIAPYKSVGENDNNTDESAHRPNPSFVVPNPKITSRIG